MKVIHVSLLSLGFACRFRYCKSTSEVRSMRFKLFYFAFCFAAAAFATFFRLLLIMTMAKKDPTTVEANSVRMTGNLIAQTRSGKSFCRE